MFSDVRSRLTFANVTSVTALVFAMGGGAYALSGIPGTSGVFHGCVNNKTGALRVVKSAKACRHRRVIRRAGKRVVIPGELAIAWSQTGPRGPEGLPGLQGRPGSNGTDGTSGTNGTNGTNGATNVVVRTTSISGVASSSDAAVGVNCNPGERATGGGATFSGINSGALINASYPLHGGSIATAGQTPDGWESFMHNATGGTQTAMFYAICASP